MKRLGVIASFLAAGVAFAWLGYPMTCGWCVVGAIGEAMLG